MVWHGEGDRIKAVHTFIPEAELPARERDAYCWFRAIWGAGIECTVVAYTLNDDHTDFETLEELLPPWFPDTINYHDRIAYEGPAYLLPGVHDVMVDVHGEFAIGEAFFDLSHSWYCIEDVETGDELWLTEPLLYTSRFLSDERRRKAAICSR